MVGHQSVDREVTGLIGSVCHCWFLGQETLTHIAPAIPAVKPGQIEKDSLTLQPRPFPGKRQGFESALLAKLIIKKSIAAITKQQKYLSPLHLVTISDFTLAKATLLSSTTVCAEIFAACKIHGFRG